MSKGLIENQLMSMERLLVTSGTFRSGLNCTHMQEQDEQQQIPWVSFVIKAILSFKLNSSGFFSELQKNLHFNLPL